MQTTFVLDLNFGPSTETREIEPITGTQETHQSYDSTSYYELRVFCRYDKVIAFDENNGSIRAEY